MLYYSKYDDIYKIIKHRRIFEELEERERERLEDDVDSFYVYTVIADRLDD